MNTDVTYRVFGEHAVLLDWPSQINESTHDLVVQTEGMLSSQFQDAILETVCTYHSLAIYLKVDIKPQAFIRKIKEEGFPISEVNKASQYLMTIPVCYNPKFALDMGELVKASGVSTEVIIALHTAPIYTLYFMGFLPGFPYLGGLPTELYLPRKTSPRIIVEKGSVAIGGSQTGIYPANSPGGWNIIGKTPLDIFDIQRLEPSIFKDVSKVRFRAISLSEFELISTQIECGNYHLEKEVWNG